MSKPENSSVHQKIPPTDLIFQKMEEFVLSHQCAPEGRAPYICVADLKYGNYDGTNLAFSDKEESWQEIQSNINSFLMLQKKGELVWLIDRLRGLPSHKTALEIGFFKGGTHLLWKQIFDRVCSIENDPSYPLLFLNHFMPDEKSILVIGSSRDAAVYKTVQHQLPSVDFLFIDGDHTYWGVRSDYFTYAPLVRPGGIVALHDAVLPECRHFLDRMRNGYFDEYQHDFEIFHMEPSTGIACEIMTEEIRSRIFHASLTMEPPLDNLNVRRQKYLASRIDIFCNTWIRKKQRILIYGAGEHTANLFRWTRILQMNVVGIADDDPKFIGQMMWGHVVVPSEKIPDMKPDVIVISCENASLSSSFINRFELKGIRLVDLYDS
ncbi:hypothetical protein GMMP1_370018 [Candidatus Magnetomoraceae bacterium gMMP-1]